MLCDVSVLSLYWNILDVKVIVGVICLHFILFVGYSLVHLRMCYELRLGVMIVGV
jgi:hypothetical protein